MREEKFPFEQPKPELDVPQVELEIVQTPSTDKAPDIRSIINVDEFDEKYPPLPSEIERNTPKKPSVN